MKTQLPLKKLLLGAGLFFLLVGINSCSDDDDEIGEFSSIKPTGIIEVQDNQTLSGNTIEVQKVTVGQLSWLSAVYVGAENTNNFIAQPLRIEKGTHTNVEFPLIDGAIPNTEEGTEVVLKLYADQPGSGIPGQWDASDLHIRDANNNLVSQTITVFTQESSSAAFASFDINGDGYLDVVEILATYYNTFSAWDADEDNSLNMEEFFNTLFENTNADDDGGISEEEWNAGISGMYSNWSEDDFDAFDTNADDIMDIGEWNSVFETSGWFEFYDSDSNNLVTEEEWNAGLFKDWDENLDNLIDETEFLLYRPYVTDWHSDPESYTFGWYDTNRNGNLDLEEATETFIFSAWWDVDDDGRLSKEEFHYTIFYNADSYYDENVSKEEWDTGYSPLFGIWVEDDFSEFDQNSNGHLNITEWNQIFEESGWFEAYDTNDDNYVTKEEWNAGLFADWDVNDDNSIDEEEFDSYISYAFSWIRW